VDPSGNAAAEADNRELPPAHGLDHPVVGGAVEAALAQRYPAGVGDDLVEVTHRGVGFACRCRRAGVEWVAPGLDHPTLAGVAEAGEAVRDDPVYACLARGGE
jgi:hypothetical protein